MEKGTDMESGKSGVKADEKTETKVPEEPKIAVAVKEGVDVDPGSSIKNPDPVGVDADAVPQTKHRFLPCGRMTGPYRCVFYSVISFQTIIMFLAAAIGFTTADNRLFPLIGSFIFSAFLSLLSFILTSTTEPGVVPPQSKNTFEVKESELKDTDKAARLDKTCDRCNIRVAYSTHHCRTCNACVKELDHHCGVTGICIGARNKIHFTMLQIFSQLAIWHLFIAPSMFFLHFFNKFEDSTRFYRASYSIAGIFLGLDLLFIYFWIGTSLNWHSKKFLFKVIPSPIFFIHRGLCRKPTERHPTTWFVSLVEREPICWNICGDNCTVLKSEFP